MATRLFKYDFTAGGIIEDMFDGSEVGNLIENSGWHPTKEGAISVADDSEQCGLVLRDLDLSALENDDIREIARSAGIEGHDKKRIWKLKEEIKAMED